MHVTSLLVCRHIVLGCCRHSAKYSDAYRLIQNMQPRCETQRIDSLRSLILSPSHLLVTKRTIDGEVWTPMWVDCGLVPKPCLHMGKAWEQGLVDCTSCNLIGARKFLTLSPRNRPNVPRRTVRLFQKKVRLGTRLPWDIHSSLSHSLIT